MNDNEKFFCTTCGRGYKHKKNLRAHERYECGKEPQFCCPYCPYRAKIKCNLRAHVNVKHFKQQSMIKIEEMTRNCKYMYFCIQYKCIIYYTIFLNICLPDDLIFMVVFVNNEVHPTNIFQIGRCDNWICTYLRNGYIRASYNFSFLHISMFFLLI